MVPGVDRRMDSGTGRRDAACVGRALIAAVILVAGCAPGESGPGAADCPPPIRILIAGPARVEGAAARIAAADPEGLLRDVRVVARAADVAVAPLEAGGDGIATLLEHAGFGLVPRPGRVPAPVTAGGVQVTAVWDAPDGAFPIVWVPLAAAVAAAARNGAVVVAVVDAAPSRAAAAALAAAGAVAVVFPRGDVAAWTVPGSRGTSVAAAGLGHLLDETRDGPGTAGAFVEVLASPCGASAHRIGDHDHRDLRAHFTGWGLPGGDAVLLGGGWWSLSDAVTTAPARPVDAGEGFTAGDLEVAAVGDVTGDGADDIVAAYRHPVVPDPAGDGLLGPRPVDEQGRSAHLGVFTPEWEAVWRAGRIPRPVDALTVCDGAVALRFTGLDGTADPAAGAATWEGFGLRSAPDLPGPGTPACADVDGDGRLDALVVGREANLRP
jgi:hypothetical protein